MRLFLVLLAVAVALLALTLDDAFTSAEDIADVTGDFGDPVPGLSDFALATFEFGREVFERRFTRAEGLGPHFNASSCASCHEAPVAGGSSQRYRDFFLVGRTTEDGSVVKMYPDCTAANRDTHKTECCLPSLVIPHYGPKGEIGDPVSASVEHPPIPAEADVVARRNAPPIFGIGLFQLVSDEEILSRADPSDADGDGISGRVNVIPTEDNAIGRFGYKCQTASIEAFNRGALVNQMGITSDSTEFASSRDRPEEESLVDELFGVRAAHAQVAVPRDRIVDYDDVRDPEIRRTELLALVFFQENLAAPRRGAITEAVLRGEELFDVIGCTSCHTPSLSTPSGLIYPYTDLLLHDMGPDLADDVVMHQGGGSEFRTQPLWGLCQHAPFLHDGSADTLDEAIRRHGGEATAARDRYEDLDDADRQDLQHFLGSL